MGRRVVAVDPVVPADVEALDAVRRSWFDRRVREGDSPAVALERALAHVPASERMRAVDPDEGLAPAQRAKAEGARRG
jgi:hypothetical protein